MQKKELIKSMQSAFKFESTNVPSARGERGGRGGSSRGGPRGDRPFEERRGDRPYEERRGDRPFGERRERKPEHAEPSADAAAPAAEASTEAAPAADVQASPAEKKQGNCSLGDSVIREKLTQIGTCLFSTPTAGR